MDSKKQFDFWYAVNNTELLSTPTSRLETFGDTIVNYYLVSELMDNIDKAMSSMKRIVSDDLFTIYDSRFTIILRDEAV